MMPRAANSPAEVKFNRLIRVAGNAPIRKFLAAMPRVKATAR